MAKVVPQEQQPDAQEENDLEILHPEQEVVIAGVKVVIREYGFVEGLKIRTKAKPFIHGLQEILSGGQPSLEEILDLLAEHLDLALELVADSADMPLEWVHSLSEHEGDVLLYTWWSVCGPFFVRSAQRRVVSRKLQDRLEKASQSAGEKSTPPSSEQATELTKSETTPGDK